jgi:hypothetical protein
LETESAGVEKERVFASEQHPVIPYRFVGLGSASLGAAAERNLELTSQGKTWSEVWLRRVRLVPVQ